MRAGTDTTRWPSAAPPASLPMWPLLLMFGFVPLWWALGALSLLWPLFGVLLGVLLLARGRVALPAGTALWLVFLGIVVVSFTRLVKATGYLTSGLRLGWLITAFVVGLYVYGLARERVPWERLCLPLCLFWLSLVGLGWVGVLAPRFVHPGPITRLLPAGITSERFVYDLTLVRATEFNPLGQVPIYRPSAPYPYTNNWGLAYSLLVPFVLAYLCVARRGPLRIILLASLPLSVVPAFLTLNRGMFLGLGAGLAYLGVRAAIRGHFGLVVAAVGVALGAWLANFFIPVSALIFERTSSTDTTSDRLDLYVQTWDAVLRSPLLGYGAPASVDTTHAAEPLGTQGLVWQVLYSYGIPALCCVFLLLAVIARRLAAATSPAGQWLSTIPVIALVVTPFYAYIDINFSVITFTAALGLAAVDGPVNRISRLAVEAR